MPRVRVRTTVDEAPADRGPGPAQHTIERRVARRSSAPITPPRSAWFRPWTMAAFGYRAVGSRRSTSGGTSLIDRYRYGPRTPSAPLHGAPPQSDRARRAAPRWSTVSPCRRFPFAGTRLTRYQISQSRMTGQWSLSAQARSSSTGSHATMDRSGEAKIQSS